MKRNLSHFLIILLFVIGASLVFIYVERQGSVNTETIDTTSNKKISDDIKPQDGQITTTNKNSETTSDPKPDEHIKIKTINQNVPFTSQAPTGQWEDERQQDGCEEASALMAMYWVQGKSLSSQEALTKILAISDYEQKTYGEYRDISLPDVRDWIFKDYFKNNNVEIQMHIKDTDIIKQLIAGNIILLPMNGQKLHNPYFTSPGPERHMIVIRGYDPETDEFITNDPGTKRGEGFRYSVNTIMNAILVYPTGYHLPADENIKSMLVIKK